MADAGSVRFERSLPVRHRVDVFVAGGGPAGVAAAVAAAREGASVYVAEAANCFGGIGTSGLLNAFMSFADGRHFLAGGVGREVYDRMIAAGAHGPDDVLAPNHRGILTIKTEMLKLIYDELVGESGAGFTFHTRLVAVECSGGHVSHAVCAAKSGVFAVEAKVFCDCTGDGDLAAWAGAEFEKGDEGGHMMAGTLCSLWANIDWRKSDAAVRRFEQEKHLPKAFGEGVFTIEDPHMPGIWRTGVNYGGGNVGHTFGVDGTDERSLTEKTVEARRRLREYERFFKEYLAGYEDMELIATGSLHGVRETRRILGDYVLNLDDYKRRAVFEDEIGRYNYVIDIHASSLDDVEVERFQEEMGEFSYGEGESYGIPYRILTPRGLDNVYVAGRSVSTDRYLLGSIRVMPGCFITGQAAGLAAAMAARADTGTRGVDVKALQGKLKEMGGYLPNC
jgi:hypothetical protein